MFTVFLVLSERKLRQKDKHSLGDTKSTKPFYVLGLAVPCAILDTTASSSTSNKARDNRRPMVGEAMIP
jgi:hypothetical protein